MKISILGQEYELRLLSEEEFPKLVSAQASGLAELYNKQLIINKDDTIADKETFDNLKGYTDKVIRHEIIHAYFHEAGLTDYCNDEKLVDWLALQIPKIANTVSQVEKSDFVK